MDIHEPAPKTQDEILEFKLIQRRGHIRRDLNYLRRPEVVRVLGHDEFIDIIRNPDFYDTSFSVETELDSLDIENALSEMVGSYPASIIKV